MQLHLLCGLHRLMCAQILLSIRLLLTPPAYFPLHCRVHSFVFQILLYAALSFRQDSSHHLSSVQIRYPSSPTRGMHCPYRYCEAPGYPYRIKCRNHIPSSGHLQSQHTSAHQGLRLSAENILLLFQKSYGSSSPYLPACNRQKYLLPPAHILSQYP